MDTIALASFALALLTVATLTPSAESRFGETIDDKVTDSRFRNMGQAYISEFDIVDSLTNFEIILEDTLNEAEYWVVDFQKFDTNGKYAVDPYTGDIHPENTGECSNVIFQASYEPDGLDTGYYFSDTGNFVSRNVSLLTDLTNGNAVHKRLFTSYVRGNNFTDVDSDGNNIQRRDYILTFDEDFGFFFNCTDVSGSNIWQYSDTTDTIEFRTTIYFTNVRPVDPTDGTKGMSWVTSSVDLIYRLTRIAIINFIVSSTALVKPVLDFVIIEPYFPPSDPTTPDAKKASIEFQFKTTIESTDGELLSFHNATSLEYIPKETTSASFLNMELDYEYPEGPQQCQYVSTARCRQVWNFKFVLDLDAVVVDSDLPIDATGTFRFQFSKYQCTDPTEKNPDDCTKLDVDPLTISLEVTIQTVVQVLDSTKDTPTVQLVSMTGENGEDLRYGDDRRGVNHLEPVSITMRFLPEVLRQDFGLQLTLFMVCRSDWSASERGCLSAMTSQRYVAYSNENFTYEYIDDSGNTTTLDSNDLEDDNTVQNLTTNYYDAATELYNMGFVNSALSQQRQTYTITTVFKLVQKAVARRRRRDITASSPWLLNTRLGRASDQTAATTGLVPYGSSRPRTRRDLREAANLPQGQSAAMVFNGCPDNSTFREDIYHCECNLVLETYSTDTYSCMGPKSITPDVRVVNVEDVEVPGSGGAPSCVASSALSVCLFIFVEALLHIAK